MQLSQNSFHREKQGKNQQEQKEESTTAPSHKDILKAEILPVKIMDCSFFYLHNILFFLCEHPSVTRIEPFGTAEIIDFKPGI